MALKWTRANLMSNERKELLFYDEAMLVLTLLENPLNLLGKQLW